jgi:hypothetical protein
LSATASAALMTALSVSATLDKGTSNMPEDMTGMGMEPLDLLLGKAPSGGHVRRVKYEKKHNTALRVDDPNLWCRDATKLVTGSRLRNNSLK